MAIQATNNETPTLKIAVIGAGSWATAIVKILSEKNVKIYWWFHREEDAEAVKQTGHNPRYLTNVMVSKTKVKPTHNLQKAIQQAQIVFLVVPSAYVLDVINQLSPGDFHHKLIVSAIKGIIPGSNVLITDYLTNHFLVNKDQMFIIGGPCHAEEVALEKQSYLTLAGQNAESAQFIADLMRCAYISIKTSDDLYGIEFAAVLKNIVALACGICHGLGYGDNFQAVLVSNAMQEMRAFLSALKVSDRDLFQSAYLGDLLVTAYSTFSRNRTFGNMIGRGYTVKAAKIELGMVAEGYFAVKSVYEMMQNHQTNMPIVNAVYNVLYKGNNCREEMELLQNKLS
jgi:glycerol-3-phosphate dehydrogenase (NAD(P)+)